ncbi:conserved hypothetical protein [Vibrio chagasii]|nr:conserved hypothetical protein [Vibrio chagasii]
MCEKQKRIEELQLEISEIHKNYSETRLNDIKEKYHPVAVVLVPILIAFLAGAATVIAAVKF